MTVTQPTPNKPEAKKGVAITAQSLIAGGVLLAVIGAVLAFALDELDGGDLNVQALGGILLATGAVLAFGGAIAAIGGDGEAKGGTGLSQPANLKSIVGLVAVLAGVIAVTALTIITVTALGDADSQIAVTSSAFGVISAVVTAYLGIKISAESSNKANDEVKEATEKAAAAEGEALELRKAITKLSGASKKDLGEKLVEVKESPADEAPPPAP
jgi:hypothetical protein